jgi:hypothetical protein
MTVDSGLAVYQNHPLDELRRLRTDAAQTRLRAIRSQIAAGLTLCSVAESAVEFGHAGQTTRVTGKLWKLTDTIHRHLNEPNHVPSDEVEKLRTELAQLESRIRELEERKRRRRVEKSP